MSAPAGRHTDLDRLTEQLPAAAAQVAMRLNRLLKLAPWPADVHIDADGQLRVAGVIVCPVCLTSPCDCLIDHEPYRVLAAAPGRNREVQDCCDQHPGLAGGHAPPAEVCAWCNEGVGWCRLTGGPHPCEGLDQYMAAMGEAAAAPVIDRPIRAGDHNGR